MIVDFELRELSSSFVVSIRGIELPIINNVANNITVMGRRIYGGGAIYSYDYPPFVSANY